MPAIIVIKIFSTYRPSLLFTLLLQQQLLLGHSTTVQIPMGSDPRQVFLSTGPSALHVIDQSAVIILLTTQSTVLIPVN